MRLSVNQAYDLAAASMVAVGHTPAEAKVIADHLIDSELRGLSFGGLPRALSVVERIQATTSPRRPIRVIKEGLTSAAIDGGDQVGYLVGQRATEMAIEKAKASGMAVVGAHDTWYTGMFSYYLEQITRSGFVGMVAGSAPQKVAPHGGTQPRFGTNPIAFGFPADPSPIIWDIGTSSIMAGEVVMHARAGTPLPEGTAFDKEGNPTRDAMASAEGAWTVWGGHKGSGLAMVVQLLGMMCGAAADPVGVSDCGFFLFVVDPGMLTSADDYRERVGAYGDSLRSTRPADPAKPVRVPFERSAAERERRRANDVVEVPDETYHALLKLTQTPEVPAEPAIETGTEGTNTAIKGSWNLLIKTPMGDQTSSLIIDSVGPSLSGTMSGSGGKSAIENGRIDGNDVSWSARITNPMPLKLDFAGLLEGDELTGSVVLGAFGTASFAGQRV